MKTELNLAKSLAIAAGQAILKLRDKGYETTEKVDYGKVSPLTSADIESNRLIVEGLQRSSPYPILSEESCDSKSRLASAFVWVIDPLDGTKNFIRGEDEFTVNIALVKSGEPVLGVIYVPCREELYFCECNIGSYVQYGKNIERLSVSSVSELWSMTITASKNHRSPCFSKIEKHFKRVLSAGSSLKGCLVASGRADAYVRFGQTSDWDICAMHAIINGAGGKMSHLDGSKIVYNRHDVRKEGFVASNNVSHDKLLRLIKLFN